MKVAEGGIKSPPITKLIIYRISPTQTPVLNMSAKAKATNTLHSL